MHFSASIPPFCLPRASLPKTKHASLWIVILPSCLSFSTPKGERCQYHLWQRTWHRRRLSRPRHRSHAPTPGLRTTRPVGDKFPVPPTQRRRWPAAKRGAANIEGRPRLRVTPHFETLKKISGDIRWYLCNIFSTQDNAVAVVAWDASAAVFMWKGDTLEEYWECTLAAVRRREEAQAGRRRGQRRRHEPPHT